MARKSPWQQFSDNFSSVYGSFKELGSGIESARIMAEEPLVQSTGLGPGPQSVYQANYGGKNYNEEITPAMLTGLRNQRLADVKRKYGDVQGAMDMELKGAQLIESQNKAKLDEQTFGSNVQIAENQAAAGTVGVETAKFRLQTMINEAPADLKIKLATAAGVSLDNDNKVIGNYVAEATKDDLIAASKLGIQSLELQNINMSLAGEGYKLDNAGKLISNEIAGATKGLKINREALENARMILANKGLYLTTEGQVLDLEKSKALHATELANSMMEAEIKGQELKKKDAYNKVYSSYAEKAKLGKDEGGFQSAEEANQYVIDGVFDLDPALGRELENNYKAGELQHIIGESALMKNKVMVALREGGVDAVKTIVDEMNGINNVKVETKDGIITMTEITPDGKFVREIASGAEGEEFQTNLDMFLDPANMTETSKAYHDNNLLEAQAEYYKAQTAAKGVKDPLTKDQWAIKRLASNPNDRLAFAILLGENYTAEDIAGMGIDADIDTKSTNGNGGGDSGGSSETTPKKEQVINVGTSGIAGITQVDVKASEKIQSKQKTQAKLDVKKRVEKVFDVIKKDYIPRTLDSSLNAEDRAKQELRNDAVDWVKANKQYFYEFPGELAAFEADPEGWVATKTAEPLPTTGLKSTKLDGKD